MQGIKHFNSKSLTLFPLLLLTALAFLLYWPALYGDFIVEDWTLIAENRLLTQSPTPWIFWTTLSQADYWPLSYSVYWLLWHSFKLVTLPYHLVGILLHAANSYLFYGLLKRYKAGFCFMGALLFLIHPVQVEAVAWIFQIKTLLAAFFMLASWHCYLISNKFSPEGGGCPRLAEIDGSYWVSLGLFALSVLSKTSTVVFPAILIVHELILNSDSLQNTWKKRFLRLTRFMATALTLLILNQIVFQNNFEKMGVDTWSPGIIERVSMSFHNFLIYSWHLLAPFQLLFIYPKPAFQPGSLTSPLLEAVTPWLGAGLLGGMTYLIGTQLRRVQQRNFCLGASVFILALLPVLGFVNIPYMRYSFMADHWQYLSICGFSLFISQGLHRLFHSAIPFSKTITSIIVLTVCPIWAILTYQRASLFESEEKLLTATLKTQPQTSFAWYALGVSRFRNRDLTGAELAFQNAYEISPHETMALYNLAVIHSSKNEFQLASTHLLKFLESFPKFAPAYNLLASIKEYWGDISGAAQTYQNAVDQGIDNELIWNSYCRLYQHHPDRVPAPFHCRIKS